MTRLFATPALAALSACCQPHALPDAPRLHVVAAPSGGVAGAAPSASPAGEADNAELTYRPAQCVEPIKAHDAPFLRKGE